MKHRVFFGVIFCVLIMTDAVVAQDNWPKPPPAPQEVSRGLRYDPPKIIFWPHPAMLVFVDGIALRRRNDQYALNCIANTPFTVVESSDGWFYCYGGRHWYFGTSPEGQWQYTTYLAPDLPHIGALIDAINDKEAAGTDAARQTGGSVRDLLFSNGPAELVCSDGPLRFEAIPETRLLYAANCEADLLLDSLTHDYYLLLSGRWFAAKTLSGPLQAVPADSLPADFGRIPETSAASRVLPCVPGTAASRAAVIDAGIPQTSVVDRRSATTNVSYDGEGPRFASIPGTHLAYVYNTASVVIRARDNFYCLDKGVWFQSRKTRGPWVAATRRPEEIEAITPDCPIYFSKYVYIYGSNDSVVYTGFTAGYLQCYVDGTTVVYGTGYHYPVYAGDAIFPRPATYGFGMWYCPGQGWTLGYPCTPDWLNTSTAWGTAGWNGGWFGPLGYRPPYVRKQQKNVYPEAGKK